MEFFTQFKIPQSKIEIDYKSSILSLGSCFAENIGEKLQNHLFNCLINPFGILFHPLAIERNLLQIIQKKEISSSEILFHNEQYLSLHTHSSMNKSSKEEFMEQYHLTLQNSHLFLKNATHLIITLGTSWVYEYLETNEIIANCHKLPQSKFSKKLLTVEIVKKSLENIINIIHDFNPNLQIIFTISPVRHFKDGFMENTQSKSHLITALYEITENQQHTTIFPAYEIMLDELRDYRFYKTDYQHPNEQAIQYIWEKFQNTFCNENTKSTIQKVAQIQKDLKHKPFNENSESHQKFLNQLQEKISIFVQDNPLIKFN